MRAAVVGLVCLMGVGLWAQQQAPVFRTGVQYVSVDVVVTDADDRPVRDLTKDDFELFDRSRAQEISDFRFVDIPLSGTSISDIRSAPPASDVVGHAPLVTNSRLWVVIIDTLHTLESEIVPMKQVMHSFVQSIAPSDEVAIIYPNRSDLGTNFTTDRARMLAAIEDVRAASGFAVDAFGFPASSGDRRSGRRASIELAFSLKQSANALASAPHARRAIVLMGAGSPANMSGDAGTQWDVFDEFKDAYQTAREANVPIYTIDPRGVVVLADALRRPTGSGSSTGNAISFGLGYQKDNLHVAAINTGGRAFVDRSNVTGAMEQLVEENGSFYLLGFYPNTTPLVDRFNEIEVRVKRPGLKVRARAGYHASNRAIEGEAGVTDRLQSSMRSAIDVRGLGLRAAVAPLLPTSKTMRTAVTVHVTYPMLLSPDDPFDVLRLHVMAVDGDGRTKAEVEREYTVRPPRAERETVAVVINDVIDLPPQELTMRIGVASQALARAGTLQLPVHAPKPGENDVQLGAIVLGTPGSPSPPSLGDDFVRAVVPFQPTTRRTFNAAQTLRVFAPVFWKGREEEARVTLTLQGNGVTLQREERLRAGQPVDGRRVTSLDTLIGLEKLNGPFTLTLTAHVNGRGQATRDVRFAVQGRPPAGTPRLVQ